jgi:hypothetical protein
MNRETKLNYFVLFVGWCILIMSSIIESKFLVVVSLLVFFKLLYNLHIKNNKLNIMKEPQLEDFYDISDPRGCSTSEYNDYLKALEEYNKQNKNE